MCSRHGALSRRSVAAGRPGLSAAGVGESRVSKPRVSKPRVGDALLGDPVVANPSGVPLVPCANGVERALNDAGRRIVT